MVYKLWFLLLQENKEKYFSNKNAVFSEATRVNRGILVYNICLISVTNPVPDGATNKSVLNIERSKYG